MNEPGKTTQEPFASFFYDAVVDKKASEEAGRDIFKQVEMIRVVKPGDKTYELVVEATEEHQKRFPQAYRRFKDTEAKPESGTPLEMVPPLTPLTIAHLKAMGVKTLEGFAGLEMDKVDMLPAEVRDQHKTALAYLEVASDKGALAGKYAKLVTINEALEEDLAEARATIEALKRQVKSQSGGDASRPRGRPPGKRAPSVDADVMEA